MIPKILSVTLLAMLSSRGTAAECMPTPQRSTGNHYEPVTEEKTDIGKGVTVKGRVLAAAGCVPVANARVAHWQADEQGQYIDRLRAYQYTDQNGRYQFETEWPNLNPPHIHFIVNADGYTTLETQWIGGRWLNTIEFDMVVVKEHSPP